jgi:hypothetical protein
MARRSFRQRARGFISRGYARTRTIVQKVYPRRRRQSSSFFKKNKTVLTIGVLAAVGWFFRDKIKSIFTK